MSTSRQLSESRAIPTRTVLINDTTQLPHDYCTTPGGTLFSTTPGGKGAARLLWDGFGIKMEERCCRWTWVFLSLWPVQNKNKAWPRPHAHRPLSDWLVCSAEILMKASLPIYKNVGFVNRGNFDVTQSEHVHSVSYRLQHSLFCNMIHNRACKEAHYI